MLLQEAVKSVIISDSAMDEDANDHLFSFDKHLNNIYHCHILQPGAFSFKDDILVFLLQFR